jgi:hypothetical protein
MPSFSDYNVFAMGSYINDQLARHWNTTTTTTMPMPWGNRVEVNSNPIATRPKTAREELQKNADKWLEGL